jgi:DNA-binding transcriptional LysR family regulator
VLRPILDDFLDTYPAVSARLHLLDRPVNLIDEGVDVALRIAHLPDSSMVARRVGEVRRVIVAAPSYLAKHPPIDEPDDLAKQQIIAFSQFGVDSWSFPPVNGSTIPRTVQFTPRLVVNTARGGRHGHRRARRDPAALLSSRRACPGRPAADRAEVGRARPSACSYRHAAGQAFRSQGPRLRGLRRAPLAGTVRALAGDAGT